MLPLLGAANLVRFAFPSLNRALMGSSLLIALKAYQDTVTDFEANPDYNNIFNLKDRKNNLDDERKNAIINASASLAALNELKSHNEVIEDKVVRESPAAPAEDTLLKKLSHKNDIDLRKVEELSDIASAIIDNNKINVEIHNTLSTLLVHFVEFVNISKITQTEIAASTTKQAHGIIKQTEHIAATKQSTVNVTNEVQTPSVNVTNEVQTPSVNVTNEVPAPNIAVQNNIDFEQLSQPLQDVVSKLDDVSLNAKEQKKIADALLKEEIITDIDGNTILDSQGQPISATAIKLDTLYKQALARAKEAEVEHQMYLKTAQSVKNLDGRAITKDDGTPIVAAPRDAALARDAAQAKNEADEAEFELDDDEIDELLTPALDIPDMEKHVDGDLDNRINNALNTHLNEGA